MKRETGRQRMNMNMMRGRGEEERERKKILSEFLVIAWLKLALSLDVLGIRPINSLLFFS